MYLRFTTLEECQDYVAEVGRRKGFIGNITSTFAKPILDKYNNYVIPKPLDHYVSNLTDMFEFEEIISIDLELGGV